MLQLIVAIVAVALLWAVEMVARAESPKAFSGDNSTSQSKSPESQSSAAPPTADKSRTGASPEKRSVVAVCPEIGSAAAAHHLPAGFLTRLIWQESRFDPAAVSEAGAQGIAQFMPATARWRGLVDAFDPYQSVHESARWLGELRRQFGNLGLAAAAYNAGPKRVQDWLAGKRTLPRETRAYVRIITGLAAEEWARPGVRDNEMFLPATPDCQIKESLGRIARRPVRQRLASRALRRPGARQEAVKASTWSLQLVGDRLERKALADYRTLQKRFPKLLGTRAPVVMKRQLGGRGANFWYQVRIAEVSRERANALCAQLRSAGGQCLVLSN